MLELKIRGHAVQPRLTLLDVPRYPSRMGRANAVTEIGERAMRPMGGESICLQKEGEMVVVPASIRYARGPLILCAVNQYRARSSRFRELARSGFD